MVYIVDTVRCRIMIKDEAMNEIAERIRSRRLELHMSLQEVSDITGMSKSTLQRYETGFIKNVPLSKVTVIAHALKTSEAYIMCWTDDPERKVYNNRDCILSNIDDEDPVYTVYKEMNKLGEPEQDRVFDLVMNYIVCSEFDQGRISSLAKELAFHGEKSDPFEEVRRETAPIKLKSAK